MNSRGGCRQTVSPFLFEVFASRRKLLRGGLFGFWRIDFFRHDLNDFFVFLWIAVKVMMVVMVVRMAILLLAFAFFAFAVLVLAASGAQLAKGFLDFHSHSATLLAVNEAAQGTSGKRTQRQTDE